MLLPLQITTRNVTLTPATRALIRRRARKLESFYDRLTACEVLVETPHRHQRAGRRYNVRIHLTLPAGELVVRRQPETQLAAAIQRAFEAAQRRLEDYARRQRGDVKRLAAQPRGRVVRLFPGEGYGFIETADGGEVYFHRNSVPNGAFNRLEEGTTVRFIEQAGTKGPQASTVAPVRRGRRYAVAR